MALRPLQAHYPLGQFDGYDTETTLGNSDTLLGGEVVTLVNYTFSGTFAGTDDAAYDADGRDGYVGTTRKHRAIATRNLPLDARPLFLADEGANNYGTLFGELVGAVAGKKISGGQLGPHTAAGSGKVTCWDKPGLYAVTLDAVDTAADGLVPGNATLDVGDPITATSTGLLTPVGSAAGSFDSGNMPVARFVEFSTDGSLVTTPNFLVSSVASVAFTQVVIHFDPEY